MITPPHSYILFPEPREPLTNSVNKINKKIESPSFAENLEIVDIPCAFPNRKILFSYLLIQELIRGSQIKINLFHLYFAIAFLKYLLSRANSDFRKTPASSKRKDSILS